MLPTILRIDFAGDVWTIQLRHPDNREATARFTPDAFKRIRECSMGQFLLHAWLARAAPAEVQQPNPSR